MNRYVAAILRRGGIITTHVVLDLERNEVLARSSRQGAHITMTWLNGGTYRREDWMGWLPMTDELGISMAPQF